jgi:hypothetical protein
VQVGLLEIVFITNILDYIGKNTNISYMNELFGSLRYYLRVHHCERDLVSY